MRPIFRDKTDLGAGELTQGLQTELQSSNYLIVICSPHSAKSKWVEHEIDCFKSLGRFDRIIPFIVSGEPHSNNPSTECLNPALSYADKELLGINIKEIGKSKALIKVIAKLLDLRFDALWGRERRRILRTRVVQAIMLLTCCALGALYWDYKRPSYEYFENYVDQSGIPQGINPLNKEQRVGIHRCYCFEKRRIPFGEPNFWQWRLNKVSYINASGQGHIPSNLDTDTRYTYQDFIYSKENGKLIETVFSDAYQDAIMRYTYSDYRGNAACIVDFKAPQEGSGGKVMDTISTAFEDPLDIKNLPDEQASKSSISRYVYKRNEQGYITQVSFHSDNRLDIKASHFCDQDCIAGMEYTLTGNGLIKETRFLNLANKLHENQQGVAIKVFEYDEHHRTKSIQYLNAKRQPVLNAMKWSKSEVQFDDQGKTTQINYYGTDGKACVQSENVSSSTYEYDEQGNIASLRNFGPDGKACLTSGGFSIIKLTYNKQGYPTNTQYEDIHGNPCLLDTGYQCIHSEYDHKGRMIAYKLFDLKGNPVNATTTKAHQTQLEYDERGNMTQLEFRHITADKRTIPIVTVKIAYSALNQPILKSFYGSDGKPTVLTGHHAHVFYEYDDMGNLIKSGYLDTEGKPCAGLGRIAYFEQEFDQEGRQTRIAYFDKNGNACLNTKAVSMTCYQYDEQGKLLCVSNYGIDGNLCTDLKGIAKYELEYNDLNQRIARRLYNTDNQVYQTIDLTKKTEAGQAKNAVIQTKDTAAEKFDEKGRLIEYNHLDAKGKLSLNEKGYAQVRYEYNQDNRCVKTSFLGTDGKPRLNSTGFSVARFEYDQQGHIIRESAYGIDGKPILNKMGYASLKYSYNAQGKKSKEVLYGIDGKPITSTNKPSIISYDYDKKGNLTRKSYFDRNNKAKIGSDGYASINMQYDQGGNIIKKSYYGTNGQLCLNKQKFASCVREFNADNQLVHEVFYGTNGKPCTNSSHYSSYKVEFDQDGQKTEYFYDLKGNNILLRNQLGSVYMDYNAKGKKINETIVPNKNAKMSDIKPIK